MKTISTLLLSSILLCISAVSALSQPVSIAPGFEGREDLNNPTYLTEFKGKAILVIDTDLLGEELYTYDGNTVNLIRDINVGPKDSDIYYTRLVTYHDTLFFVANDGIHGDELWYYDGINCEMVTDLNTKGDSYIDDIVIFQDEIYFNGYTSNTGIELYSYKNGQISIVRDFLSGSKSSSPNYLIVFGDKLFFSIDTGISGHQLYYYTGTEFKKAYDPNSGPYDSYLYASTIFGSKLLFSAVTYDKGRELCYYDTITKTGGIIDINIGAESSNPVIYSYLDSIIVIEATTSELGEELYKYNGETITLIKDINPTGDSKPDWFKKYKDELFFRANDGVTGIELYKYNGTSIEKVQDMSTSEVGFGPWKLEVLRDTLYFSGETEETGSELWYYAGDGIKLVYDSSTGYISSFSANMFEYNNNIYYRTTSTFGNTLLIKGGTSVDINNIQNQKSALTLYNNTIEIDSYLNIKNITIYNTLGIRMNLNTDVSNNTIEIASLKNGLYFITIVFENNTIETHKFIIK